jgi:hypothetical protein
MLNHWVHRPEAALTGLAVHVFVSWSSKVFNHAQFFNPVGDINASKQLRTGGTSPRSALDSAGSEVLFPAGRSLRRFVNRGASSFPKGTGLVAGALLTTCHFQSARPTNSARSVGSLCSRSICVAKPIGLRTKAAQPQRNFRKLWIIPGSIRHLPSMHWQN